MKKLLIFLCSFFIFGSFESKKQGIDPCRIYGIIFFEQNKFRSDARIYIEENEDIADLAVYKEDNRLFADEEGLWYVTDNPALADYKLYIEKDKRYADFSVSYIKERNFVGCQF